MKPLWVGCVVLVTLLVAFLFWNSQNSEPKVCFDNNCFSVEIVDTLAEREKGLMYREELGENDGMLFIFESEGNYPFWMKNTLIPLDIIWIDSQSNVLDIKNAVPCEADPCPIIGHNGEARYVLEINGGVTLKKGIIIDQKAEFKNIIYG